MILGYQYGSESTKKKFDSSISPSFPQMYTDGMLECCAQTVWVT